MFDWNSRMRLQALRTSPSLVIKDYREVGKEYRSLTLTSILQLLT